MLRLRTLARAWQPARRQAAGRASAAAAPPTSQFSSHSVSSCVSRPSSRRSGWSFQHPRQPQEQHGAPLLRLLSIKPPDAVELLEALRAEQASKNLRIISLVFVAGAAATVAGIWSEIQTAQIETWVTRVYDTFALLNGVGKFAIAPSEEGDNDGGSGGSGEGAADSTAGVEASEETSSIAADAGAPITPDVAAAAVHVWKFLMSDAGVRSTRAGAVVPWEVVRGHAFTAAVAAEEVDIVDILSELSDAAGPGVDRDDFLALCGSLYVLSRDIRSVEDGDVLRSMLTLAALVGTTSGASQITVAEAEAAGSAMTNEREDEAEAARAGTEALAPLVSPLECSDNWLRAMAVLGIVRAVHFTHKGAILHPREVADKIMAELLSTPAPPTSTDGAGGDGGDADGAPGHSCLRGLPGNVFVSAAVMKYLEFDMFRKRNDQKYTGHTLLKEYNRRQRFVYSPARAADSEAEEGGEQPAVAGTQ